jgi:ribosomal protein S18 acetylase RimI-like enzyme
MVDIRRIRVNEAPLVRELVRAATEELAKRYPDDEIGISEHGLSNLETQFRLGAVHEDELTLVAAEAEEVLGFVCAWITRGRATPGVAGEIDWLWVQPGPTRADIERRLAGAAVRELRARGAGPIFRMEDTEHPILDLWEGLGFVGDVTRYARYA